MTKVSTANRVVGVVAVSYLVLIPVGAALLWNKVRKLDEEMNSVWEALNLPATAGASEGTVDKVLGALSRVRRTTVR